MNDPFVVIFQGSFQFQGLFIGMSFRASFLGFDCLGGVFRGASCWGTVFQGEFCGGSYLEECFLGGYLLNDSLLGGCFSGPVSRTPYICYYFLSTDCYIPLYQSLLTASLICIPISNEVSRTWQYLIVCDTLEKCVFIKDILKVLKGTYFRWLMLYLVNMLVSCTSVFIWVGVVQLFSQQGPDLLVS